MLEKSAPHKNIILISKSIITGGLLGGILGTVASIWSNFDTFNITVLTSFLTESTLDDIIMGPILWIIIGGVIGAIMALYIPQDKPTECITDVNENNNEEQSISDTDSKLILPIREEQLKIHKKKIKTGEVSIHKETFTEEKNIKVPVTREELVIKKKNLASDTPGEDSVNTIRIPISEEQIDISKHKVILEDVKVFKHQSQDIEHIEEILKKEKLHVKTIGDAKLIDEDNKNHS
jgi:uncharacterized protein (TIGR02271 family)